MGYKALVIDDDLGLLVFVKQWLEREGFTVLTARSGREGLQKTSEMDPDLIVLDVMINETLGRTTWRQIRSICSTPIVVLTALVGRDGLDRKLELGENDPMTRSCSFEGLRTCIQEILSPPMRRRRHVLFDDARAVVGHGDAEAVLADLPDHDLQLGQDARLLAGVEGVVHRLLHRGDNGPCGGIEAQELLVALEELRDRYLLLLLRQLISYVVGHPRREHPS